MTWNGIALFKSWLSKFSLLAAEREQMLGAACVAAQSQEPVLQPTALQVAIECDTDVLDFNEVAIGDAVTLEFNVLNAAEEGAADLELASIEIGGDVEFDIIGGTCEPGTVLEPGADCNIEVSFVPNTADDFTGEVTVEANGQAAVVGLFGTGIELEPGIFEVDPGKLHFGNVEVGEVQADTFVVTNVGAAGSSELTLSRVEVISGEAIFTITPDSTCEEGLELAPQESCTIEVDFAPDDTGAHAGALCVESASDQIETLSLSGVGTDPEDDVFSDRFELKK